MRPFGHRDRGEREIERTVSTQDAFDEVGNGLPPSLGRDRRAGVQY